MFRKLLTVALALSPLVPPAPAVAQNYPIDCAILLCLAGGWPASVPCARARAEFIRRITPWPIEPPLQIWNCPMHAAFRIDPDDVPQSEWVHEIAALILPGRSDGQIGPLSPNPPKRLVPVPAVAGPVRRDGTLRTPLLQLVQSAANAQADIDISGRAFDFVRSIKVWHIMAYQFSGRQCATVTDSAELGSYDLQGAYAWTQSATFRTPSWMRPAWLQTPPTSCRPLFYRAIGVEWRDYFGQPGHQVIPY